ncbi:F-actin-capping protein subunit beta [Trichomonascus vanleenenianus]|uniref:F-actin-capping protein subunit beta n=1 Tax=Trichomonascus vanleenenianus TaxID=2268995 RepID=UPI003ECA9CA5
MASDEAFDASLDLLRRLNPRDISDNLNALCKITPALAEDLLSSVDQPLGVKTCPQTHKKYLTCDYNRDGDSYRSPWSGDYNPAVSDAPVPSEGLRKLEVLANESFDIYRDLYYEGGISSVYLWDQEEGDGFAGVALLKKQSDKADGIWDSIHVFEVEPNGRRSATYRCTSTVILDMKSTGVDLSGSLTRQIEKTLPTEDEASHVANIGSMVEEIESKLRNVLNEVYFGKTRDIVGDLRSIAPLSEVSLERTLHGEVVKGLGGN